MEMTEPFKRQTRCGGGWPGARVRRWELFSLWPRRGVGFYPVGYRYLWYLPVPM